MEKTVKLIAQDGRLCTSHLDIVDEFSKKYAGEEPSVLLYQYSEGDWDAVNWPNPNEEHLRSCLFDCRETGMIPDVREVQLPDGTIFQID